MSTTFTRGENPLKADKLNTAFSERVARSGDAMTGPLELAHDPTLPFEAATKQYVDRFTAIGVPTGAYVGASPPGNALAPLWWNSTDGQLYVQYNDGSSTQWVVANSLVEAENRSINGTVSVLAYGARLDGTTNDTASVQAALNSGYTHVVVPAGKTAYCPGGITIPPGVTLDGTSLQMDNRNHLIAGSTILVDGTTPVAVRMGVGVPGSNSCAIQNIRIKSTSLTPNPTTIGILVDTTISITFLTNVMVYAFGVGIKTRNSISVYMHNIATGVISDAHYINDGTPEVFVTKWRMGLVQGDANPVVVSNCYTRMTGGNGGAAGANTMRFSQCQFNDSNQTKYLMEFVNYGVASSDNSLYVFHDSFCQGLSDSYFYSDATWPDLHVLQVIGCDFGAGAGSANPIQIFKLHPNTSVHEIYFSATAFFAVINMAPTAPADLRNIHITGCSFSANGPSSFTATTGGTMSLAGNMFLSGTLTFNGNWGDLSVVGNNFNAASSLINNATGNVKIIGTNPYALYLAGIPTPARSLIGSGLSLVSTPKQGEFELMTLSGVGLDAAYCASRNTVGGSTNGAAFVGQMSRGAAYGTHGAVGGVDGILSILAYADDGTNFRTPAGALNFAVEGTVSTGIVPTRFAISTVNSAGAVVQGLAVNNGQAVTIANLLRLGGAAGPTINTGTGAATGTQPKGSMWLRTDGAVGSTLYVSQGGGTWNAVAGV